MEETGMRRSVGKMIHTLREMAGISQNGLAEGILSVAELSRVENGEKEEELLREYHECTVNRKSIHKQYLCQMRAVNYYLTDADRECCIQNQLSEVVALYRMADFKLPEDRILCLLFTNEHNEIWISNEMVQLEKVLKYTMTNFEGEICHVPYRTRKCKFNLISGGERMNKVNEPIFNLMERIMIWERQREKSYLG